MAVCPTATFTDVSAQVIDCLRLRLEDQGLKVPEQYEDEYRATLERVIEAKLGAAEPVTAAPAPARGQVVDLMEALKASIQATKKESRRKQPAAAAPKKQRKKAAVG